MMIDFIIISAAYILSIYLEVGDLIFTPKSIVFGLSIVTFFFVCMLRIEFFDLYRTYRFRPLTSVLKNVIVFEMLVLTVLYFCAITEIQTVTNQFSKYFFFITISVFTIERTLIKIFLTILRKAGFNYKRYLIVGGGELGFRFYQKIQENNLYGIKIIGFVDDLENENLNEKSFLSKLGNMVLGSTDQIEQIIIEMNIDSVIVALPLEKRDKIITITNICEKCGVKAELVPDYYTIISENPSIRNISGYPVIGIRNVPLENIFNRVIKRVTDVSLTLIALIFLMPFFLIIMFLIKFSSKGPVFFKQKRTGYRQKDFNILKFRTMVVNKDADLLQATENDPRKTKLGSFLRRYNIDELPQLINILRGDMSIVGPRPHMLTQTDEFYNKYDKYHIRHWVKPGLTGWAQVNGWRGSSDIAMRVKYDIYYIENWSIWFDFKIIWLTVFGKRVKNNAY